MAFLARYRTVVPLHAAIDGSWRGTKPAVAITFDDGYRCVLDVAAPILRAHGFPAVCFVPADWIGTRNAWDEFDDFAAPLEVMDAHALKDAERSGVIIESHGSSHRKLDELSPDEAYADLQSSVDRLHVVLGRRPRYLAYPYGVHTPSVREAAARAGFEVAFSIGKLGDGPLAFPRVTIRREQGMAMYAFKTSGRYLAWRYSRVGAAGYSAIRPWVMRRRTVVRVAS
jgi:peptidoglycan/xylan/chitin deacetylase (PgdA/CDA1 family)